MPAPDVPRIAWLAASGHGYAKCLVAEYGASGVEYGGVFDC